MKKYIKLIIGWSILVLLYVGLFWVLPYFGLAHKSDILWFELITHCCMALIYGIARVLAWAFN